MFEDYYMTADDVAKALKISKSFAYKVIRKMNAELQEQGFFTMAGNAQHFGEAQFAAVELKIFRIEFPIHPHLPDDGFAVHFLGIFQQRGADVGVIG